MPRNSDFNDSKADRFDVPDDDSWLNLEIRLRADQPELLLGLDEWLQLNLISQRQVKQLARQYLSCALPSRPISTAPTVEIAPPRPVALATPIATNAFQTLVRSFVDELSIRWLLFLGIFLVVVSSGVLAASQWQNFPNLGQYLVLLIYTLGFWGIAWWTGQQKALRLTSQTLMAIATLLMPINFWAISYLGLPKSASELTLVALAAVGLTGLNYLAVSKRSRWLSNALIFNSSFALLSYAHLGWRLVPFPETAIYAGIIGLCIIERLVWRQQRRYPVLDLFYVFTAWSLLILRQLIGNTSNWTNYSLAIALAAWLISSIYLTQRQKIKLIALKHKSAAITNAFLGKIGKTLGIMLFLTAWLTSILAGVIDSALFFTQTIGISLLAIHLFSQRLRLYWQKKDLTAIFLIGLQAIYISKELIPSSWRGRALDLAVEVSKTEYFPESVFGITLFPYVVLFVLVATWFYRQQKNSLGRYTETLTFMLGLVLSYLSFANPTWKVLNLLCSTLTLSYVVAIRRPLRRKLIYVTHLLGLITILNAISWGFPDLEKAIWGSIFLVIATIEWFICLGRGRVRLNSQPLTRLVTESCWYFGLGLSTVSYSYFLSLQHAWGLIWLATPIMLTAIAQSTRQVTKRRWATTLSCYTLIAATLLVLNQPAIRLAVLALATGLMYFNVFNLRRTFTTVVHLGLVIAAITTLAELIIGLNPADYGYWLVIGSTMVVLLYRLRLFCLKILDAPRFGYISQRTAFGILGVGREARNYKLVGKYIRAADYWAIAIAAGESIVFSLIYFRLPVLEINGQFLLYLVAIAIVMGAIYWRYSSQPNNLVLYALVGLGSIFATGCVGLFSNSNLAFASCNLLLGLATLAIIILFRSDTPWTRLNFAAIPLVYAVISIFWRLPSFNAHTGLLTCGAAFIALNTNCPNRQLDRTTKYLGFAGISAGIYELVIYQMQSQSGGSGADALTIFALIAAAIAFGYRLVAWRSNSSATIWQVDRAKLILIAHIHWAFSSLLKIAAAGIALETNTPRLTMVSIATSFCLGAYAVIQGRDEADRNQRADWWVYVGLVEISATLVYSRLIISKLSLFDPWRLVFTCGIALLIYQIPWHNFGWRSTPWQRTAIVIPVLMALVTAEDISYFSLLVTTAFYLRIAYAQQNVRWSYISLGLLNWLGIRLILQYDSGSIWFAAAVSLSLLYIAQFDQDLQHRSFFRHYLRILGSSILCLTALIVHPGILPGAIAFGFILTGLGLRVRAFLFAGTITLILTVLHQLLILVLTYSILKWVVGLLAGLGSIALAAGFEQQRERVTARVKSYSDRLRNWQ
ncbi:MAG: hypothetical protein AAFQ41_04910 [Cyanobacteria bacterium J06623_7]